jgi:quercetin dioxygenase-like cupin family protein
MEVLNNPRLAHLALGDSFKVLQINGEAGMKMPQHHSTQEAVIIIQEGEALLQMLDGNHILKAGTTFIIPAKKEHTLTIVKDLKAFAIMGITSEINFI